MGRQVTQYAFILMFLLIAVTFYVGLTADLQAFARGAQQIIWALTGRQPGGVVQRLPAAGF